MVKSRNLYKTLQNVEKELLELKQLIGEIFEFNDLIIKSINTEIKTNRLKRLPKNLQLSERSSTPKDFQILAKKTHSRSYSRNITITRSLSSDRRLQFLQESRFNRKMIDCLTDLLVKKMSEDPGYLEDIKNKDKSRYFSFKEEFIHIHQDS